MADLEEILQQDDNQAAEAIAAEMAEMEELMRLQREAKNSRIEKIGQVVGRKRDAAVTWRRNLGIEKVWQEDEEYYCGVDNGAGATGSQGYSKPASMVGGLSVSAKNDSEPRCTAFFPITRQFCDAVAARMGDMLLPSGDWNFAIKPSPVQDKGALSQADAVVRCKKAELRIRDWLVEGKYHAECRKVIDDCVRIGTGILKGPFPSLSRKIKADKSDGTYKVTIEESKIPISKCISVWDYFPAPGCGENHQDGNYTCERDRYTAKQLKDMKKLPGFLGDQIDKVLQEGPNKCHVDGNPAAPMADAVLDGENFEAWIFHGMLSWAELADLDVPEAQDSPADKKSETIPAVVVIVNDTPIKAFLSPLDSGEFPYDVVVWQKIPGIPFGHGVARQGRTPQDMLLASGRALMDNAGIASGSQIVIRDKMVRPANKKWVLEPRKIWIAQEGGDFKSVADVIMAIDIPMHQEKLMPIMQLATKMMEDATGVPFILQGQQGSATNTYSGMQLLQNNASAPLRKFARNYDQSVTEPHIRRYYEYLLLHGQDEMEKGDMNIEALGSTALVEREIKMLEMTGMMQMALNPAFGLSPEKVAMEFLKAKNFSYEDLALSDEDKQRIAQQPQRPAPAVEAAQINAKAKIDAKLIDKQATEFKAKVDTDRDRAYVESMTNRDTANAEARRADLMIKRQKAMDERELKVMEFMERRNASNNEIKKSIAETTMKLRTQERLSHTAEILKPAAEPAGKAPAGQSFAK